MVNVMALGQKDGTPKEAELVRLRSEIRGFKSAGEKKLEPHCSSDLLMLKHHFRDHLFDDLERPGSSSLLKAGHFENYGVLIKNSYRMTS